MKTVDELRENIKSTDLKLREQEHVLKEAEQDEDVSRQRLMNRKERMNSHHTRIKQLIEEKIQLEGDLKLREAEIEILKDSARKERECLIALREEEVAEYQTKLTSVEQELEEERQKIPPLKEVIQQLLEELMKKSKEVCHLRNASEETKSQLKMEREKVEMKTKELAAAAVSHDVHKKELQDRKSVE